MTDSRLHIPLSKLWPDIRIPGIPVVVDGVGLRTLNLGYWHKNQPEMCTLSVPLICDPQQLDDVSLDLSRPMVSDILARRVAVAAGMRVDNDVPRIWHNGQGWVLGSPVSKPIHCAAADLDPTDDTRLDWGNLGSPRVVDLVALGMVAQHLYAQEQT